MVTPTEIGLSPDSCGIEVCRDDSIRSYPTFETDKPPFDRFIIMEIGEQSLLSPHDCRLLYDGFRRLLPYPTVEHSHARICRHTHYRMVISFLIRPSINEHTVYGILLTSYYPFALKGSYLVCERYRVQHDTYLME